MVVFEMADHGPCASRANFAADHLDHADLAASPDPEPTGIFVAAIAIVTVNAGAGYSELRARPP
jgi:hypothetical protein